MTKSKKIAIIGKLPSKFKAPFNDKDWCIWGCNVHSDMKQIPRFDLWFDLHINPATYKGIHKSKLITATKYPYKDAIELLGGRYFNSSMIYMVVYAILQGATDIALYGVRLDSPDEVRTQQLNVLRNVLFFAKGRGINVTSIEDNILTEYELYK